MKMLSCDPLTAPPICLLAMIRLAADVYDAAWEMTDGGALGLPLGAPPGAPLPSAKARAPSPAESPDPPPPPRVLGPAGEGKGEGRGPSPTSSSGNCSATRRSPPVSTKTLSTPFSKKRAPALLAVWTGGAGKGRGAVRRP